MKNSNEFGQKLGNCASYRSLRAEQEAIRCLRASGWEAYQSPYYTDIVSGKSREIDVVARQLWTKVRKHEQITARVNIFTEVKSAKDFHILCSGRAAHPYHYGGNEYWIGYSSHTLRRIEEIMVKAHLDTAVIRRFMHLVEKVAFPRNTMRPAPLRVRPPPNAHCFSAFRETNTAAEKELDNSVLWKAVLALRSSIEGVKQQIIDGFLGDFAFNIELALREKKDPFFYAKSLIKRQSQLLDSFTPLVVIDSTLWSAEAETPIELEWFRFVQLGATGNVAWWADVINSQYLEKYIYGLGKYYEREFHRARAKKGI